MKHIAVVEDEALMREELADMLSLYTSDAADERTSVDLGGCRIL